MLGHHKPSNVDHRKAADKREFLDKNIQLSRKVEQLQAELQLKQVMLDESSLSVDKLQRSRRRYKNISKKPQTTETIVDTMSTVRRLQTKLELQQEFDMVVTGLEEKTAAMLQQSTAVPRAGKGVRCATAYRVTKMYTLGYYMRTTSSLRYEA